MLPNEPYLHSSGEGDLVAEFAAATGPLTMIVSSDCALALAIINGQPTQTRIPLVAMEPARVRAELSKVTDALRTALNAPVAAQR
jgi:hypothetical protein